MIAITNSALLESNESRGVCRKSTEQSPTRRDTTRKGTP